MIEMRKYITDNGYEMSLPATDERVMTIEELTAKYAVPQKKSLRCPHCGGYCHGDCK